MSKVFKLKTACFAVALGVVGVLAGCAHPQLVSMGERRLCRQPYGNPRG